MVETRSNVLGEERNYRGGFEVRNHAHAGSTGSFTTLFDGHQDEGGSAVLELSAPSGDRLVPRQPMCHQPPLLHATVPESRSPSPGEVCEASSRQSRNGKDRVDAGAAVYSTLIRRHQIRRPEPVGQRGLRPVKNGPGGQ